MFRFQGMKPKRSCACNCIAILGVSLSIFALFIHCYVLLNHDHYVDLYISQQKLIDVYDIYDEDIPKIKGFSRVAVILSVVYDAFLLLSSLCLLSGSILSVWQLFIPWLVLIAISIFVDIIFVLSIAFAAGLTPHTFVLFICGGGFIILLTYVWSVVYAKSVKVYTYRKAGHQQRWKRTFNTKANNNFYGENIIRNVPHWNLVMSSTSTSTASPSNNSHDNLLYYADGDPAVRTSFSESTKSKQKGRGKTSPHDARVGAREPLLKFLSVQNTDLPSNQHSRTSSSVSIDRTSSSFVSACISSHPSDENINEDEKKATSVSMDKEETINQ